MQPVWRFLKKLKIKLPYDSAILFLPIYWKDSVKNHIHIPAALLTVSEHAYMPISPSAAIKKM